MANPTEEQKKNPDSQKKKPGEPELVGNPKAPSGGGEGDIKKLASLTVKSRKELSNVIEKIVTNFAPKIVEIISEYGEDELYMMKSVINSSLFDEDVLGLQNILNNTVSRKRTVDLSYAMEELETLVGKSEAALVAKSLEKGVNEFISKTIAFVMNDVLFDQASGIQYDSILEEVQHRVTGSLDEFMEVYVADEINKIMEK